MSAERPGPRGPAHRWEFKARFRRHAFGWKSQPAIVRIRQAVAEIRKVARKEPMLAAEGAVVFLERLSPALEHIDSSSGAIGSAVNRAISVCAVRARVRSWTRRSSSRRRAWRPRTCIA